ADASLSIDQPMTYKTRSTMVRASIPRRVTVAARTTAIAAQRIFNARTSIGLVQNVQRGFAPENINLESVEQASRRRVADVHRAPIQATLTAILGISAFYHDSAAALIVDGAIVAAAQEERFTRQKYDAAFPSNAVEYCLAAGALTAADLNFIAFYDKPFIKF